jgi:gliding motility-associated-like protein
VKSSPLYWFPNTFTPGSTIGLNDGFGLRTPNQISKYHLIIYNLWGQILFETTDVNQTWDGTYNSDLCPIGAYVYHSNFLSPEGELKVYQGDITIIR